MSAAMTMKKTFVGGVAAVALLVAAGCGNATSLSGSDDIGASGSAGLSKSEFAATLQQATKSARSVHMIGTFQGAGQSLTLTADQELSGSASIADLTAKMSIEMSGMGSVELRLVDGVAYMNVSKLAMSGMLPQSNKPWIKVDLTDPSGPFGSSFGQFSKSMDAASIGRLFTSASQLKELGPANIDGVQTTKYRVTIDTSKAASGLGVPTTELGGRVPATLAFDVWLDTEGRPTQISANLSGASMTFTFSKWGEPVNVQAPPASQVGTFSR